MEVKELLLQMMEQQKEFQEEVRTEIAEMKEFRKQTMVAFQEVNNRLDVQEEKLNDALVGKYDVKFITEKLHQLEKEIYIMKNVQ